MDAPQDMQAIEDWDNYQGADIYDYRPLTAPSTDIKEDMEAALFEPESTGAFAHSNVYTDAPNPCLNLDGVGPVGLPLGERDAFAIASVSVVGTGLEQGLWTLPGDKVHFDNPQWTEWVTTAAASVNTALALDVPTYLIRCRLRSLTLRNACAQSLGYFEQMRYGSGQYGILSVILPSRHIGGQIRITHQGATETFSIAWNTATTVVGAYTGLTQSFDPIQSGYVLRLCYELDYLGPSPSIPQLPTQLGGTATRLRHVFRSWRQRLQERSDDPDNEDDDDGAAPPFVAYLFDHTYSDVSHFNTSALQDSDRLMLKQIAPFAKAYGFDLHLAQVTYSETGGALLDIDPFDFGTLFDYGPRRFGYGYGFDGYDPRFEDAYDELDADDVDMGEVEQRDLAFHSVSTLEGMPMQITGKAIESINDGLEAGTEYFMNGDITDGERESDFERYDRSHGSLTYTYKHSTVIISPKESEGVKFAPGDISSFAYAQLKCSVSVTPSTKETLFTSALLRGLKENRSTQTSTGSTPPIGITAAQVVDVLRDSADRWNNVDLFLQVLQNCGAEHCLSLIGIDGLLSAYQAFDWNKLKDLYAEGLSKTTSSSLRRQVVERLMLAAMEQHDFVVVAWCLAQREQILDTMQTFEAADIEWALDLAKTQSNPTHYLQTSIIPRLHTAQPYEMTVWKVLLTRLDDIVRFGSSSWDVRLLPQITKKCLEDIVTVIPPYAVAKRPRTSNPPGGTDTTTINVLSVEPVIILLELGSRLGLVEVCMPVLQRMWAQRDAQKAAAGESADLSPTSYYAALVPRMKTLLQNQDKPRLKQNLEPFFEQAVEELLPLYLTHMAAFQTALQYSSNNVFEILKNILTVDRVKETFKTRAALKEFALFISEKLRPRAQTPEATANLEDILKWCLARLTRSFRSLFENSPGYGKSCNAGIELLRLCYALRLPESSVDQVIERFSVLPPSPLEAGYIKSALLPLLKALPDFLATYNTSLTAAPYSHFAARVMKIYVEHVLGPKPPQGASLQDLRAVGCGCPICNVHLVPFLTDNCVKKRRIRENKSVRTHLEQRLARTLRWGVTWTTHRVGSPHTLEVEKPQSMVALGLWVENQKIGEDLLKILGNEEQQRQILGSEYQSVIGMLAGVAARPPLSTIQVNGVNPVKRHSDVDDSEMGVAKKPRLL